MPTALQNRALAFVVQLGHERAANNKPATAKEIRDSFAAEGQEKPGLRDVVAAVDWALAQPRDFSRYLQPLASSSRTPQWAYKFPNGHHVSVLPDPRPECPFRFEMWSTDPAGVCRGGVTPGLTTEQVEAKLAEIAALPAADDAA